jgi:hypothetical protein
MAHHPDANRDANRATNVVTKRWLWLLVIPWVAMIWVPSYNRIDPQLWGFPFFYWYQLFWVLVSSVITALVYFKTRDVSKPGAGQGRGGAQ